MLVGLGVIDGLGVEDSVGVDDGVLVKVLGAVGVTELVAVGGAQPRVESALAAHTHPRCGSPPLGQTPGV